MDNYIRVYKNAISDEKCQHLIEMFESDTENHEIQDNGKGATLTQINFLHSSDTIWRDEASNLANTIVNYAHQYKKDYDIKDNQWPKKLIIEPPKIKRYTPGGKDRFPEHVDVQDYKTAQRFLVAFIYLDNNEKGQTVISPKDDTFVSFCIRGSLLLFPSLWPWLHTGMPPIDKPKYIVGSYLHYT